MINYYSVFIKNFFKLFSDKKTEIVLFLTVIISPFIKSSLLLQIIFIICLFSFFIKGKIKFLIIFIIIFLKLFLSYTTLIIDYNWTSNKGINYSTTKGNIYLSNYYEPGTLIIGSITKGENVFKTINIPIISKLLSVRKDFSYELYVKSESRLKLTQALTTGDRSFIDKNLNDKFIISGLAHLLAISGFHVGIIVTTFYFILFFIPRKLKFLIIPVFLIFYMPLAAFNIPVIRASLTAIIIFLLLFFDIKINVKKFILFIATIFILVDPTIMTSISFILSFAAVVAIIYAGFSSKNRFYGIILNTIYIGLAAQTVTIPITLYMFGTANILSVFTTLLLLPFINLNTILGLLAFIQRDIFIYPLIILEKILVFLVDKIYIYTFDFFFLFKINLTVFLLTVLFMAIVLYLPKYRWLIVATYVILFIPVNFKEGLYIWKAGNYPAIVRIQPNNNQVYFNGNYHDYRYKFLPVVARFKLKHVDSGSINLKDEKNLYIKIDNISDNITNVCLKSIYGNCKIVYLRYINKRFLKKMSSINKIFINNYFDAKDMHLIKIRDDKILFIDKYYNFSYLNL